jgi:hypothetical protein
MRPRFHIALPQAERDMLPVWHRRALAVCALLAAAIIGHSMLTPSTRTGAQGASKDELARAESCVQQTGAWPDAADRQMPGQVVTQGTMPTCVSFDEPANNRRGASIRQPQAN